MLSGLASFFEAIGSLVNIMITSLVSFFSAMVDCFSVVLSIVDSLPNVMSYGIGLFIGITLSMVIIDFMKGLV